MACFHPLEASRNAAGGPIVFGPCRPGDLPLVIPCGRCVGCRSVRARSWAIRCMHESQMHDVSSFVTLTYDIVDFPGSLNYRDFQLFMYRVRKLYGSVRFYACGEYGETFMRPHFHALLFGVSFRRGSCVGGDAYSSPDLERLWPHGFSSVGDVTFDSAGYVARYCMKKVSGEIAPIWYSRLDVSSGELVPVSPEVSHMSLKPGIGATWFSRYWREVYGPRDGVVLSGGRVAPPPRFYDVLLERTAPDIREEKHWERYLRSKEFQEDCTPERLSVREKCAKAKLDFTNRRKL